MRMFNLKGECWVVPNSHNGEDAPGRTIYPRIADDRSGTAAAHEPLRLSSGREARVGAAQLKPERVRAAARVRRRGRPATRRARVAGACRGGEDWQICQVDIRPPLQSGREQISFIAGFVLTMYLHTDIRKVLGAKSYSARGE